MIKIFMIGMSTDKGGVESYIMNLCGNMDASKYEIVHCWPTIEIDGKKWVCPANRHNYFKYRAFWKRFYKENKFDVVYANVCDIVSIDHIKFAKSAGVPVRIIHAHSTGNQQALQRKMSLFHRFSEKLNRENLNKYATHLFACSETAGEWMFGKSAFRVIKNGIDLKKYKFDENNRSYCREQLSISDELLVGMIGRISEEKNPVFAVDIAESIISKNSNVRFVMIGEGDMRFKIENLIKKKKLEEKIFLIGAVDNVNEWMSAIDCILMPSLFEGLPFVLVEAQAAGVPCVVSSTVSEEANITGMIEYVNLEESPDIWAEKLKCACEKNRYVLSKKLIDAGYSIEDTADKVMKIIEKVPWGKNESSKRT